ncbi:MAG TPA: hypothetical protein VIL34_15040 [Actinopolymorphaceae bacterium]
MTRESGFKKRVRARMRKTGESYATARAHLDEHDTRHGPSQRQERRPHATLHVTNGDTTVDVLRSAGLGDPILPWRDVLHEGPVPAARSDAELRRIRAAFLAGVPTETSADAGASATADTPTPASTLDTRAHGFATILREFEARDRLLHDHANAGSEIVLWFEADLYDQLQIIQILDRLRRLGTPPERLSLVCVGEYPGVAHFGGLGQLAPGDLLKLRDDQVSVTQEALDIATYAWEAFTAPDPSGLAEIARISSPVLRHLGEAFGRLMQEYPWTSDGLSLTQRRLLLAVEAGPCTAGDAFRELGRRERRPYLGDVWCFSILEGLTTARRPLITLGEGEQFADRSVTLTDTGHEVLAGRVNHVEINGIDRWIGGVHLTDTGPVWTYDERREHLLPQQ